MDLFALVLFRYTTAAGEVSRPPDGPEEQDNIFRKRSGRDRSASMSTLNADARVGRAAVGPVRRVPRLPACRSCHQRKVKCDNNRPKCAPCTRSGTACMLIFPGSEYESVSREELHRLEQKEQALAAAGSQAVVVVVDDKNDNDSDRSPERPAGWNSTDNAPASVPDVVTSAPAAAASRRPAEVAPPFASAPAAAPAAAPAPTYGSGLAAVPFKDTEWRKSQAHLLQTLGRTAKAAEAAAEAHVEASAMPSATDVRYLFEKYLMGSHVQNPFLLRHDVEQLYERVFAADGESSGGVGQATSRDIFRTFMILAIATIVPYRLGEHPHHPLGYYLAAMPHFGSDFLAAKLESVQDLLLICRFGIFYHIGTSIWDTIQLCGRLCIELGLHRPRERPAADMLQEQIERRVFWEYYMLDRYSSTTISRPFALADRDITVPFFADADDDDIVRARDLDSASRSRSRSRSLGRSCPLSLDDFCRTHVPQGPTEMSVFLLCVRLRQISSRIQTEFSQLATPSSSSSSSSMAMAAPLPFLLTGRIYALLDDILRAIDVWRRGAPVFPSPRSLYEMPEWYDLLLARERLHAVRKAMDLAPKHDDGGSGGGLPARHLLALCLDAATNTIRLYGGLFHSHIVTYTRSYFHTVFTAGLSVMFCCCASSPTRSRGGRGGREGQDASDYGDPDERLRERERIRDARSVLGLCEKTLAHMGVQLPDARGYVTAFEALHKSVSLRLDQALQAEEEEEKGEGQGEDEEEEEEVEEEEEGEDGVSGGGEEDNYNYDEDDGAGQRKARKRRRRTSLRRMSSLQDSAMMTGMAGTAGLAAKTFSASTVDAGANPSSIAAMSPAAAMVAASAPMDAQLGRHYQQQQQQQQQQFAVQQHQQQHQHQYQHQQLQQGQHLQAHEQYQHHQHHQHQHQHQHISPGSVSMGSLALNPSADAGVSFYERAAGLPGSGPFAADIGGASHSSFPASAHTHAHAQGPGLSSYGAMPAAATAAAAAPVRNDLLQWAFLSDDSMWNVVGEYVYGDPNETLELFNGFDFGLS